MKVQIDRGPECSVLSAKAQRASILVQHFPRTRLVQVMAGVCPHDVGPVRPYRWFGHRVFSYARWVTDEGYPLLSLRRDRDPRRVVLVAGPFYAAASVFRQPRVATLSLALDRTNQGDWKRFKTRTIRYGRSPR